MNCRHIGSKIAAYCLCFFPTSSLISDLQVWIVSPIFPVMSVQAFWQVSMYMEGNVDVQEARFFNEQNIDEIYGGKAGGGKVDHKPPRGFTFQTIPDSTSRRLCRHRNRNNRLQEEQAAQVPLCRICRKRLNKNRNLNSRLSSSLVLRGLYKTAV